MTKEYRVTVYLAQCAPLVVHAGQDFYKAKKLYEDIKARAGGSGPMAFDTSEPQFYIGDCSKIMAVVFG